jgi:hypothetical protein
MIRTAIMILLMVSLAACSDVSHQSALQEARAIQWDAISATDVGDDHGGFRRIM